MSNGRPLPDDVLSAWRDGELSAAEREEVARLLEESADARAEWEDYQALSEVLRTLPDEKAPDGLRAAVMRRIERESLLAAAATPALPAPRRGRRFWIIGTLVASSAAGLLIAFNAMRDRGGRIGEGMVASAPTPRSEARRLGRPSGGESVEFGRSGGESEALTGRTLAVAEDRLGETRFGMADSARPPLGAQPGDSYSYAEVSDDGQVMVVEATVVDVDLALNRLQYLLAKNSIEPQTVALDDFARSPIANSATNGEFGVYVVSDPEQIRAALADANEESGLFKSVHMTGVLPPPEDAALGASANAAGNWPDGTDRRAFARDTVAEQLRDRDAVVDTPVLDRARMSLPAERFTGAAPAQEPAASAGAGTGLTQAGRSEVGKEVEAIVAPKPTAEPAAAAIADTAAVADKEAAFGYQQVVNVSRAAIDEQLRQESLVRQNAEGGLGGGEGRGVQSNSFFVLPEQTPEPFSDLQARLSTEQKAQADKARQKVRLLVLLQAEPTEAPKVEAGASFQPPVEAPQPARE